MGDWAVPTLALALLAYSAVSGRLQVTVVSQAMVFVALGLLVGTDLMDVVRVDAGNQFLLRLAEATLALVLFTDAVRVNLRRLKREIGVPVRMLVVGLPLTIVAGTLLAYGIFPDMTFWAAAVLATILAPTDAALGLPVVSNERLPSRVRQGLNVESGLNDGICVPLLIVFLTLAVAEEGEADVEPVRILLEEIGLGSLAGGVAAAVGAVILRSDATRGWMSRPWRQINGLATPLLAYSSAAALGGSGFIAAFVAGLVYSAVAGEEAEPATTVAENTGELLNALTFLLFGAVLLGPALEELDWRIAAYAVLSLTVVRMAPVAVALAGNGMRPATVGFLGWFGPRGLASIVFVLLVLDQGGLRESSLIATVVTVTVALSVLLHGMTAWPGAARYADWYAARAHEHAAMPESTPATTPRPRAHLTRGLR
jgi:sodium/hydrogen antiporter